MKTGRSVQEDPGDAICAERRAVVEGPYLMGVDFGTGSVRVGIFDSEGTAVAFHVVEYETRHPRPGWAEQDPDEWWSCVVASSREAMEKSGLAPEEIVGISVDATASTVLAIDEKDRHIRSAIMWMDVRAADQARRLGETGDPALKYNGYGAVSAEWMPPKALWLKENELEAFNNARHICDCGDWLVHRLTGTWAASINVASTKWYYDRNEGGYPETLYSAVGLEDVLDKLPQDMLELGSVAGELRRKAAEEMGLEAGTPVAQGGVDAFVGALGLGVVEPARLALITGSSHVMIGQAARPLHGQGIFGAFTDALIPGQYTVEGGQVSTGSVVAWFKNRFASIAVAEAKRRDVDSPGHIFRAIMEGICYGTEHVFRTMREHGFKPTETVVAGGPTKSELWMQMHADVSNVPISLTREGESAVLGSAMLAAVGAGVYPDIQTAAQNMVHTLRTIEPDPERHEAYSFYVDRYIETYPQMRELMHRTVRHVAGSGMQADTAGA
jgi:ribulose kinase